MKSKVLLLALCCFLRLTVCAQTIPDCASLLKRTINNDGPRQVFKNFGTLNCFGLDAIDRQMFVNGPVMGTLLVKISQKKGQENVTYGDILAEINKRKADSRYPKQRAEIVAMNSLELLKGTPANWQKAKKLLTKIEIPGDEIDQLHTFMLQNQDKGWNYRKLYVYYEIKMSKESRPVK